MNLFWKLYVLGLIMQALIENLEKEISPLIQGQIAKVFLNLWQANFQGLALSQKKNGQNFYSFRPYILGEDDAKRINWKLMAKYQEPFVMETEAEKDFAPWILLDSSGSMLSKKNKILAIIYFLLKIYSGQKTNLLWGNSNYLQIAPKKGIEKYIIDKVSSIELKGENNLASLIYNLKPIFKMPPNCPLVIISDLLEFEHWAEPIKMLCQKHNLLLIHLSSDFDHLLPQIGYSYLKNPETGKLLLLNCSDSKLQKIYKTNSETKEQKIYADLKPFLNIWKIHTDLPLLESVKELI